MRSVHTSPSKRKARPTGWVAHVSSFSVVCAFVGVFIAQVYHIFLLITTSLTRETAQYILASIREMKRVVLVFDEEYTHELAI